MAIKFCVKAGKIAVQTIELITKAYGSVVMSRAIVHRSYARFRDGRKTRRTMPDVVVLRLPEKTKTLKQLVVC